MLCQNHYINSRTDAETVILVLSPFHFENYSIKDRENGKFKTILKGSLECFRCK